ncbi:MAG: glycoside hydrolase family 28 protein [Marinilabiliaceae bacterium]|nr:glycoside hydrolase family 28 protein [Marinilabiliaceae bacterium]
MNRFKITLPFILVISVVFFSCTPQKKQIPANSIKSTVQQPVFNDYTTSILDHGAIADGKSLNTKAINNAIESCSLAGGGKVIIPQGLWITGPIELKSNINLYLEEGALVMFSKNLDDFPLILNYFEGKEEVRAKPLIYANNATNIAITGKGVFDGSGQIWRPVKRGKLTESQWKKLIKQSGVVDDKIQMWYPNEGAMQAAQNREIAQSTTLEGKDKYKAFLRPPLVNILNCDKVLFDGPTFQNSPGWCIHPLLSKNLTFININVRNPWNAQNGDGIDFESCRYIHLENSTLDVGDDAICLKSGRDEEGRKRGVPTEDVVIKNCIVYHGHGGFVVGSEMSGGVRNVKITDCTFMGTDVGLRFKSNRDRGGIVENIEINNINMINILTNAIGFNLYYGGLSVVEQNELGNNEEIIEEEITEATPQFKNITIKNIHCNGADIAIFVNGLPEMPIENMVFENINIKSDKGAYISYAKGIKMKNVKIEPSNNIDFTFNNTSDVNMKMDKNEQKRESIIQINGERSKNYTIEYDVKPNLTIAASVRQEEIKMK